jgi:hypothetical protein
MYLHPTLGRLLAQAKIEEAQSRMPPAHVLAAASMEREGRAVTVVSATSDDGREPPMPSRKRRWFARRRNLHANARSTTIG